MTSTKNEEGLWFKAIGRNGDFINLRTSDRGNPYASMMLLIRAPMANSDRKLWSVGFGAVAESLAEEIEKGDLVEINGVIQRGRNKHGQWEEKFILREFKRLAEAPQNDPEQVQEAMQAADFDDVEF